MELFVQVTTSIYNLILGNLYYDHYGTMRMQEIRGKLRKGRQSYIVFINMNVV